ncbi:hypothetical protein NC652_015159 [Populus alba x Populus x berolinensis]|nr:hypothetical protein NC652_015159 [Populus alba x Populus x berolinensis]
MLSPFVCLNEVQGLEVQSKKERRLGSSHGSGKMISQLMLVILVKAWSNGEASPPTARHRVVIRGQRKVFILLDRRRLLNANKEGSSDRHLRAARCNWWTKSILFQYRPFNFSQGIKEFFSHTLFKN